MNSSLFRAWRNRPFALLWSGQTISLLGDRIFHVALAWWVLEETGSAAAMGMVLLLTIAPMLLFLLLGGVLVDRFPRLGLMLFSDWVRGLVLGGMAALAFAGWLTIGHVYAFSLISGFVEAFFQPAYRAAVPEVTPEADLPSANALTGLSGQLAGIAGPAIGALVVTLGGTATAFALDGLSFLLSGVCLLFILKEIPASRPQRAEVTQPIFSEARAGLGMVFASPWLWVTIAVAGLSNIAYSGPMDVTLPFLLKEHRQAGVGALGLFYTLSSVGSVLAAIWWGQKAKLRRRGLTLYGAWMLIGIMVMVIGLPVPIFVILLVAIVIGACNTTLSLMWVNTLQEYVPSEFMGRVTSVDYLGSYLLLPVGYVLGGWAAEQFGAPVVFIVGGALQTLLVASGLLHPRIRALD